MTDELIIFINLLINKSIIDLAKAAWRFILCALQHIYILMDVKNKFDGDQQIAELKTDIESLISDVQNVRLANELSKLTQVRMVDLQYSAKLVVEQLTEHLKKKEESKDCAWGSGSSHRQRFKKRIIVAAEIT